MLVLLVPPTIMRLLREQGFHDGSNRDHTTGADRSLLKAFEPGTDLSLRKSRLVEWAGRVEAEAKERDLRAVLWHPAPTDDDLRLVRETFEGDVSMIVATDVESARTRVREADLRPMRKTMPKVAVYAVCWNEVHMIPFFLKHYSWADSITVYDNESDDGSTEILQNSGSVTWRQLRTGGKFEESSLMYLRNHAWKEQRGREIDFVCIVDLDEFLFAPYLSRTLTEMQRERTTIVQTTGIEVVAKTFPDPGSRIDCKKLNGVRSRAYSKCSVFSPDAIREINYSPGAHEAWPEGELRFPEETDLVLLHLRYMGADHHIGRNRAQSSRVSLNNRLNNWSEHIGKGSAADLHTYEMLLTRAQPILDLTEAASRSAGALQQDAMTGLP